MMFCHSFDAWALRGVYTNFRTFQSVFLPLWIKGNVKYYFRGIHLQIQSKWKKHVPDKTQMQHDQSRLTSFFFCVSPCHQSCKKKLDEGICPFHCLACCCIQKQCIIRHFLSCNQSKDCPKQESDQCLGMTSQIVPDSFKWFCCSVVFWKSVLFTIFKSS